MRRIFLSAGHSNVKGKDRGATSLDGKHIEGELTVKLRDLIFSYLKEHHGIRASVDPNDSILSQTINTFKHYTTPRCIVCDIHFNANKLPEPNGVETIIPTKYSKFELQLAHQISIAISAKTGFQLRDAVEGFKGVKPEERTGRGRLAWMSLVGENILIEVCFITNPKEMEIYFLQEKQIAKAIADVLADFSKK